MYKALTIAGSDTSGGAGIQADIKTFEEHSIYGMAAITVMVAQNPKGWSHDIFPIDLSTIEAQIDTVLGGIGVDATKTGMLPTEEIIFLVSKKLKQYDTKNIVIDPVMVCKGTDEVVNPVSVNAIKEGLLPLATITTPNVYEAAQLSGVRPIDSIEKVKEAAKIIHSFGAKNVLIKGGTKLGTKNATDVLYDGKGFLLFETPMIETSHTHGAGCTIAAAITSNLALGNSVQDSVTKAKNYVTEAIRNGFVLNQYVGVVNHAAFRNSSF